MNHYVLDAWAILAWLGDEEPASSEIQKIIEQIGGGSIKVSMSIINLGEVFYCIAKNYDLNKAKTVRDKLLKMPIGFVSVDDNLVWCAAELKAKYPISYADAFAGALNVKFKATLLSGYPEFEQLVKDGRIKVKWLSRKAK